MKKYTRTKTLNLEIEERPIETLITQPLVIFFQTFVY